MPFAVGNLSLCHLWMQILTTPEELREQLKAVQTQRAIVVMLVDLLDASGSFLGADPARKKEVLHGMRKIGTGKYRICHSSY